MSTIVKGEHPLPSVTDVYPACALYARVDSFDLTASHAYGNWSPDAGLAARLECPILVMDPRQYHFFVVPPEATIEGQGLVRAVPK